MKSSIIRRPVTSADESFLFGVFSSTRADEMAKVAWDDVQKRQFLEMQFRSQTEDYNRRFPHAEHSILLVDGEPVGRLWIGRWPDELRLLDVALLPEYRSRGIGTEVLRELQEEAAAADLPLRHTVFKDNEAGLRFYVNLGFEVVKDFEMYKLMEWTDR